MTGEEISGPPGPKLLRLVCFVGAAVISTAAINKWREYERNTLIQQQHEPRVSETPNNSSESVPVRKTLEK